jgi:hypothetical protein
MRGDPGALFLAWRLTRYPEREEALDLREVFACQPVFALRCCAPRLRDDLAEILVAADVDAEEHELQAIGEREFRSDDEVHLRVARSFVGAHDARDRALVGDGDGGIAELGRAVDELLGRGGSAQEAVIAEAVELRVSRDHENTPCRYQALGSRCSR